jgi:hypothetical protein
LEIGIWKLFVIWCLHFGIFGSSGLGFTQLKSENILSDHFLTKKNGSAITGSFLQAGGTKG